MMTSTNDDGFALIIITLILIFSPVSSSFMSSLTPRLRRVTFDRNFLAASLDWPLNTKRYQSDELGSVSYTHLTLPTKA